MGMIVTMMVIAMTHNHIGLLPSLVLAAVTGAVAERK